MRVLLDFILIVWAVPKCKHIMCRNLQFAPHCRRQMLTLLDVSTNNSTTYLIGFSAHRLASLVPLVIRY